VLSSVSCPTRTFCVAVDLDGDAFAYNGKAWSSGANIDPLNQTSNPDGLGSVSCTTTTFCAAVDSGINAVVGKRRV
jgi:hypothetical protein